MNKIWSSIKNLFFRSNRKDQDAKENKAEFENILDLLYNDNIDNCILGVELLKNYPQTSKKYWGREYTPIVEKVLEYRAKKELILVGTKSRNYLDTKFGFPSVSDIVHVYRWNHKDLIYGIELGHDFRKIIDAIEQVPELASCIEFISIIPSHITNSVDKIDLEAIFEKPFKNIKSIKLVGCGLESIPEGIKNCKNLESLCLFSNDLLDIPEWVFTLKKLKNLNLNENLITNFPKGLGKLQKLKHLMLQQNDKKIDNKLGPLPNELLKLKKLKTIQVSLYSFIKSSLPVQKFIEKIQHKDFVEQIEMSERKDIGA